MKQLSMPKVTLPPDVSAAMDRWRSDGGWAHVPASYVGFHEAAARDDLKRLKRVFGLKVLRERLVDEGWCDGFTVLQADVLTSSGRHVRLEWFDSNQAFGKRFLDHGGKAVLCEGDLA